MSFFMLLWFFFSLLLFLLTVYVSPVFYGPLWTDFSINGWMDCTYLDKTTDVAIERQRKSYNER